MENFGTGSSTTAHLCRLCGHRPDVAGSGAPPSSSEVFDFTSSTPVTVPGLIETFATSPFAAAPPRQNFAPFGTTSLFALSCCTSDTQYQATSRQDGATAVHLQSISAMPTYQNHSHEELRFLDYRLRKDDAALKTSCATGDGQQSEVLEEIVPIARNVRQKGADCIPNCASKQVGHCGSDMCNTSIKSAPSLVATGLFEGLATARPSRKGYNRCNERIFCLRRQNRRRARMQQRRDVLTLPATGDDSPPRDLRSARISISTFARGTQAEGPAYERYLQVIENDDNKSQSFLPKLTKKGYELSPTIEMLSEANLSSVSRVSIKRPGFGKIEWEHSVDLRGADLDATVVIGRKAVSVHALTNNGVPRQGVKLNGCHCQKRLTVAKKRASELAIEILTTQRSDEGRRMPASSIKRVEAARSLVGAQGRAGPHKIAS
jgi:Nucleoporin autopeptidase